MSKKQLILMAAAGILLASQVGWAATVVVGHCKSGLASYSTIQGAVNGVPSGSTIYVCPAKYPEQVEITAKKLALIGVQSGTQDAAVVIPPAGGLVANATSLATGNPIAAQIWVHDVDPALGLVNISNLTLDGAGNGIAACSPNPMGFLYQNASGTIAHVVARNQSPEPYSQWGGCQTGLGIFVQSGGGQSSTVTVSGSTVHNYAKNGITGNEIGTTLYATGNSVLGVGPTTGAAQNGIQIGFGATGKMTGNSVADDVWSPDNIGDPGDAAAGLLVYAAAHVTMSGNNVANTQFGIAIASDSSSQQASGGGGANIVTSNKVSGTRIFDGIDVCTDTNTVKTNTINSSDEAGVHIDSTCGVTNTGNIVTGNTINEACAGLLVGTSPGNTTSPDTYFNVNNTVVQGDVCNAPVFNFASLASKTHGAFVPARP